MNQTAKHVIFVGRVQGVGFRFTALAVANRFSLTGLVRNLPDGTVEMVAQGPADDVDDCIRDIKETFADHIRETNIEEIPYEPKYQDFKITF
jgi:acylphosphatase